jgi:hypothetical protein
LIGIAVWLSGYLTESERGIERQAGAKVLAGWQARLAGQSRSGRHADPQANGNDAKLGGCRHRVTIQEPRGVDRRRTTSGDTLSYDETTVLEIYGGRFDHTDANELTRA